MPSQKIATRCAAGIGGRYQKQRAAPGKQRKVRWDGGGHDGLPWRCLDKVCLVPGLCAACITYTRTIGVSCEQCVCLCFGKDIAVVVGVCKADIVCAEHESSQQGFADEAACWQQVGAQG